MPIVIMPSVEGLELCSRRDEALSSEQLQVELPWAAFHRTQLEWWKDVPSLFVFPYFLSLSLPLSFLLLSSSLSLSFLLLSPSLSLSFSSLPLSLSLFPSP